VGGLVLAFDFSLSPGLGVFLVAGSKDGLFFAKKLVLEGDVSDGGVEAHGVVVVDVFGDEAVGLLDVEEGAGPNAVGFERLVPACFPSPEACASNARQLGRGSVRTQKRRFPSRKRSSATGKRALAESDVCRTRRSPAAPDQMFSQDVHLLFGGEVTSGSFHFGLHREPTLYRISADFPFPSEA
jgi:hypothetical protein